MSKSNPVKITSPGVITTSSGPVYYPAISTSGSGSYVPYGPGPAQTTWTTSSTSYSYSMTYKSDSILKLPIKTAPIKVWLDGALLTPGLIRSKAHYAYLDGQIIFNRDILKKICYISPKEDLMLAVEFKKAIYHYCIGSFEDGVIYEGDTKIIKPQLMAVVKK